ncbi:hypothetical protein VO57_008830 [Citromicrobium bathyomarinum]|nr:hypothetical protein [Citromicrobium sp. JL2201]
MREGLLNPADAIALGNKIDEMAGLLKFAEVGIEASIRIYIDEEPFELKLVRQAK